MAGEGKPVRRYPVVRYISVGAVLALLATLAVAANVHSGSSGLAMSMIDPLSETCPFIPFQAIIPDDAPEEFCLSVQSYQLVSYFGYGRGVICAVRSQPVGFASR